MTRDLQEYLKPELQDNSTWFCSGCGAGTLMGLVLRAIKDAELDLRDFLFVSGIGCSSLIASSNYAADTMHTLHGRAIPFATGAKAANPKLKVVVISGDGDLADIGGNHLIHAAARNTEITVVCADNMNYGMTGGQACFTTPIGAMTMTTPQGNTTRPFDLARLVSVAGAQYVSRFSITQPYQVMESFKTALQMKGFSFIDVVTTCPTQFGRRNKCPSPAEMLQYVINRTITREQAAKMAPQDLQNKIITGVFSDVA
jgi:2-oxoglutarate/2-oxoacid ferredoxin oxidoreductase subunit beta